MDDYFLMRVCDVRVAECVTDNKEKENDVLLPLIKYYPCAVASLR